MATKIDDELATQALESLLKHCGTDQSLQQDKDVQVIINTAKKMGLRNDHTPRIIPLTKSKLHRPKELRIMLVTKDPSVPYRDIFMKNEATADLFKEIIGIKNLRRRFRGAKSIQLYKDFDMIIADFRVHHLLPDILGSKFYHGNKKLPFVIRMSRPMSAKNKTAPTECDPAFIRAQVRNICKNTSYVPNSDNCLGVRIGQIGRHPVDEMIQNINDVVAFLTDKTKKPQGGTVKGGIASIFVKTANSPSLPIYEDKR
ncbi:UTP30 (YKR060W) [Zygosaccharomyces parabailii]|nr:UTP30 (YKR060W) [Zygosaccharomyces parabailii]CDH09460.1 probable Ribosome biogenesis protein UTP30 [Zygosaccharomyces bailii ISA1307]